MTDSDYVRGDETPIEVCRAGGREGRTRQSCQWCYLGGGPMIFDSTLTRARGRDGPNQTLRDSRGYL